MSLSFSPSIVFTNQLAKCHVVFANHIILEMLIISQIIIMESSIPARDEFLQYED